jgi:hypothetical protein
LGSAGRAPSLLVIPPAFALQTSQADTAQYKNNEQYNTPKKVTKSITISQNSKEHRIHNRENSPYQVSKPFVKLFKIF